MTDTPEPAPNLVERVAQLMANHCGADSVDQWEREFARAVVALVLDEAAGGVGNLRGRDVPKRDAENVGEAYDLAIDEAQAAIRALIPKGDA